MTEIDYRPETEEANERIKDAMNYFVQNAMEGKPPGEYKHGKIEGRKVELTKNDDEEIRLLYVPGATNQEYSLILDLDQNHKISEWSILKKEPGQKGIDNYDVITSENQVYDVISGITSTIEDRDTKELDLNAVTSNLLGDVFDDGQSFLDKKTYKIPVVPIKSSKQDVVKSIFVVSLDTDSSGNKTLELSQEPANKKLIDRISVKSRPRAKITQTNNGYSLEYSHGRDTKEVSLSGNPSEWVATDDEMSDIVDIAHTVHAAISRQRDLHKTPSNKDVEDALFKTNLIEQ